MSSTSRVVPLLPKVPKTTRGRATGRVVFVPRPTVPLSARRCTKNAAFQGLIAPASERSEWQIEAILAIISAWPAFSKMVDRPSAQREVCRCLTCDFWKENTIVYKQGDEIDGWYIVYSGEVLLVSRKENEDMPRLQLELSEDLDILLHQWVGPSYVPFSVLGPSDGFGAENVKVNSEREVTAVVTKPSYIIRFDSMLLRMRLAWLEQTELSDRATTLKSVPELALLSKLPELYDRLAEVMYPMELAQGSNGPEGEYGWMVVREGLIARERNVDFGAAKVKPGDLIIGNVRIELPTGMTRMITDRLGPNRLAARSRPDDDRPNLRLLVQQNTTVWFMPYEEVNNRLPIDIRREIERDVVNDPGNESLVNSWVARETSRQWRIYRTRCEKEARQYVKQASRERNGDFGCRRPKLPKAIKSLRSPRQHYKPLSESLYPAAQGNST